MNYYERIQNSIDYLEANLEEKTDLAAAAKKAYMSPSNFYRLFFTLCGYTAKEYVRRRRIHLAAKQLEKADKRVIDLAVQYGFESADAFSRAFKKITGCLPSKYRSGATAFHYERMDLMEKYFDIEDKELLEKYPDIKVLKELDTMRVAYYCYFGRDPEKHAFDVIQRWLLKNKIKLTEQNLRIFGYNNPEAAPGQEEYGYEVCVTIPDNVQVEDEMVGEKELAGGLYAVTGVEGGADIGNNIIHAWERFRLWLMDSKYTYGGQQWMEEHIGFDKETNQHTGGIDLYLPILPRGAGSSGKTFETEAPMWTASYTAYGINAKERAQEYLLKLAEKEGFFDGTHRFFAYYNHDKMGTKEFFYKIFVTVGIDFQTDDKGISLEKFPGGFYAVSRTKYQNCGIEWGMFIQWVSRSVEYDFGDFWFFEEYRIDKPEITLDTDLVLHMSLKKRG